MELDSADYALTVHKIAEGIFLLRETLHKTSNRVYDNTVTILTRNEGSISRDQKCSLVDAPVSHFLLDICGIHKE